MEFQNTKSVFGAENCQADAASVINPMIAKKEEGSQTKAMPMAIRET